MLISQRPRSVLDPVTTHNAPQSELEYLEVFDFFNYPRLNAIAGGGSVNGLDAASTATATAIPISPVVVDGGSNPNQTPTPGGGPSSGSSYRAAPAFVIPNPESDWLIFKPPYE
jgi:hypothetical protein